METGGGEEGRRRFALSHPVVLLRLWKWKWNVCGLNIEFSSSYPNDRLDRKGFSLAGEAVWCGYVELM
jgi:hypothetical protein